MKTVTYKINDSPEPQQLIAAINNWQRQTWPEKLKNLLQFTGQEDFEQSARLCAEKLKMITGIRRKKQLEKSAIDWLYDFIRLNVKRGRIFDLREVLVAGRADCLGYCKLFTVLGRYCGLDTGVVEVIIDNRGMAVPHTASLVVLPDNQRQFIDFWYGSKNIKHKRLGLRVKHGDEWRIEDIDHKDLKKFESVSYLPDYCVDAITIYVQGNRSLKNKDYTGAIRHYSQAILLYPQNARIFYNRAVAYENLGEPKRAKADYARALQDNASMSRTLATQPEDTVDLICLDKGNISALAQQIYLLYKGFITGKKMTPYGISRKMGLSLEEIEKILDSVESSLAIRVE